MKKIILFFFLVLISGTVSLAQLTGIKNIPGDYPTVAAAITALNTSGAGPGGVTFNIAAGHSETFPSPTSGKITTQTGSQANPIVFQKSGDGEMPSITAATGIGLMDAILSVTGGDYITFDGLKLVEKGSNSEEYSWMEWGIALLKSSPSNGSQHITIKNCNISLDLDYTQAKGIYSNNHNAGSTTQINITALSGTNSYNKIFSNNFSNCYNSIYVQGFNAPAPYAFYDQENEIGVEGANTINNLGGADVAAYGIFTKYQNNIKVANNDISCFNNTGTRSIYGIYLTTSINASFDLYNNHVSIQYDSPDGYNSNLYGIYSEMGESGTVNTSNIYNNIVENCIHSTTISAEVNLMYLRNLGVTSNVYGNQVINNVIGSINAEARFVNRYLYCIKNSTINGPLNLYNNTVSGNSRIQSAPASGDTYYLGATGTGTSLECYNNVIDDNSVSTLGSTQCLYVYFDDEEYKNIYDNTITNISNANGSTRGIYIGNGTLALVHNNLIQDISSSIAGGSFIVGINHSQECLSAYYYNNMICDLENRGSESTLGYDYVTLTGINVESEFTGFVPILKGFYNNTVYLNTQTDAATFGSAAFQAFSLYGIDMRNNIFVNTSESAGTNGKTNGIKSRTNGFTGFTSNYNCIYTGTPGSANAIFANPGGTFQTLLDYKSMVTPQELQSVTEMPPFVSTSKPYDAHLRINAGTQCEAGAFTMNNPISVHTDFDDEARYPNAGYPVNASYPPNAPDIGADEIGGIRIDLMPPAINYTPLGNIANGNPRTLIAKISDGTGVPISGNGRPRLYWKINSGTYQGVTGTHVGANNYSFTFGGGAMTGNTVSYYLVAQDLSSPVNVGAYPWIGAAGFTINPPACGTPPTTPSSYIIVQGISGEFHVGTGKTYTTLTAAANDLNQRGIIGPVTFILDDNTYPNETFPVVFLPNSGSSAVNTVTIKPNTGATPVFTGSANGTGLIMFKGLDYAILNGSNSGGTDKSMSFENTSSNSWSNAVGITTNGASEASNNITLKNCVFMGNNTLVLSETIVILFNQNGGLDGGGYNNCLIENNTIKKAKYGISVEATPDNPNHKIQIINNTIGSSASTEYITRWGITVALTDSALISGNDIMGPAEGSILPSQWGVYFYNYSTNTRVIGNKVHDWISEDRFSVGIKCNLDVSSTPSEISNNVIYNIGCTGLNAGVNQNLPYGIFVRKGGNIRIWNNSIYLDGPYLYGNDSYAPSSACIGFYNYATDQFDIRNNILRNSMTNPYPNPGPDAEGKAYGLMFTGDSTMFSVLDNNEYYINGHQGQIAQRFTQSTGYTNFPTLESWQVYTGKEENSFYKDPQYTSTVDLKLLPGSPAIGMAVPIPQINIDYEGTPRHPLYPTIGAYEYAPPLNLTWTGAVSTSWNAAGNWTPAGIPKYFTEAVIPSSPSGGLIFPVVPSTGGPFSVGTLQVETGAAVNLQNGSLLKVTGN